MVPEPSPSAPRDTTADSDGEPTGTLPATPEARGSTPPASEEQDVGAQGDALITSVMSEPGPQPGQTRRASDPFPGSDVPEGATALRVEFVGAAPGTTVNIRRDLRFPNGRGVFQGGDEDVFDDVQDGDVEDVVGPLTELYVSDVRGASGSFTVNVYAVREAR